MNARRLLDVGKVGLVPLIERRGDADHDGVHIRQTREIIRRREMFRADVLLDSGTGDVPDVALALIELLDLAGIGVEANHAVPSFGKAQSQGQPDVTAADNPDFELRAFEKFRFPLDKHSER